MRDARGGGGGAFFGKKEFSPSCLLKRAREWATGEPV